MGSLNRPLVANSEPSSFVSCRVTKAFADALAEEMKSFGLDVSLIEPGAYRSNIGKSALERMHERNLSADDSQLKDAMGESVDWRSLFENDHGDPAEVADAVMTG